MALPHSRAETFATDDVVGGSIFMSVQHWLARFFRRNARKSQVLTLSAFGQKSYSWSFVPGASTMYVYSTGASQIHRIPILLRHGAVITQIVTRYYRGGGSNPTAYLKRYSLSAAGAPSTLASVALSAGPAVWSNGTMSPAAQIDRAYAYFLQVDSAQAGDRLSQIRVSFWHPGVDVG